MSSSKGSFHIFRKDRFSDAQYPVENNIGYSEAIRKAKEENQKYTECREKDLFIVVNDNDEIIYKPSPQKHEDQ